MRFTLTLLSTALLTLAACPERGTDSESGTDTAPSTETGTTEANTSAPTTGTTMTMATTTEANTSAPTTGTTANEPVGCFEGPSAGNACMNEGEVCLGEGNECMAVSTVRCVEGVWTPHEHVPGPECGDGACEPGNFPEEGLPCFPEGASCSTDCSDQCAFCNAWTCEGGLWQHQEVFPADCLECAEVCDFVIVPMCPGGPPDTAACVAGCEDNKVGPCKIEFSHVRACTGSQPTFTCDMNGRPIAEGCEAQYAAFYACLMP